MILVFFSHCSIFTGQSIGIIRNLMEPVYVNAFFLVSGYLFFRKYLHGIEGPTQICRGYTNLLYRIVLPSVIFATFTFFPKKIIRGSEGSDLMAFLLETVGGCTYWFTSALVVVQVIMLLLVLTRRNIWFYLFVSVCFCYVGYILTITRVSLVDGYSSFPWMYKQGFIATLFFVSGGVLYQYEEIITRYLKGWIMVLAVMIYVVPLLFAYNYIHCTTSMCEINFYGAIVGILGCLLLTKVCGAIPFNPALNFIGNNSLGMYFLSGAIPSLLAATVSRICPIGPMSLLLVFVFSLIVSSIVVMLINKYMPFLFNFRLLTKQVT